MPLVMILSVVWVHLAATQMHLGSVFYHGEAAPSLLAQLFLSPMASVSLYVAFLRSPPPSFFLLQSKSCCSESELSSNVCGDGNQVMTAIFTTLGSAGDYGTFGRWLLLIITVICWAAQFASMALTCTFYHHFYSFLYLY